MQKNSLALIQVSVIIVATLLAYEQVRHHQFVWDTIPFVVENTWVREWSIEHVVAMFTNAYRANWHPLVLLSHTLDFSLFGDDSGKHHLVNLALHLADALLVYILVFRLMTLSNQARDKSAWTAFMTAMIFALHPQHVESVAWIVERKDVLYSLFALGSLLAYLHVHENAIVSRWKHLPFFLYCLSIGAKPMAITLPVIMLLVDVYPLQRFDLTPKLIMLRIAEKAHYFIVSLVVALVTLSTQSMAMPGTLNLPLWASSLNAIDNTWFYVQHYLWPVALSPYYPYPQDSAFLKSPDFWLPGSLFLTGISILVCWCWYRGIKWPLLLLAFYLVTLLPVSGLIHVGPAKAADHYVYLATLPLSFLSALAMVSLWHQLPRSRALVLPVSIVYVTFLLLITHVQVSYWSNPLTLWTRVTYLYPQAPFGHRNLAAAYAQIEDWDLALRHAEKSLELGSTDVEYVMRIRNAVSEGKLP